MEFQIIIFMAVCAFFLISITNKIASRLTRNASIKLADDLIVNGKYNDAQYLISGLIMLWSFPLKRHHKKMTSRISQLLPLLNIAHRAEVKRGVNPAFLEKMRTDANQLLEIYTDKKNISIWNSEVKSDKVETVNALQQNLTTSFKELRKALNIESHTYEDTGLRNMNKTPIWAWLFAAGCVAILIVTKGGLIPGVLAFTIAGMCITVSKSGLIPVVKRVAVCALFLMICWSYALIVIIPSYPELLSHSGNLIHDTIEIPEMSATILVSYPKNIERSSWDNKYYPKVTFKLLSGNGKIYVSSGNLYVTSREGSLWHGGSMESVILKQGKSVTSDTWFTFNNAKHLDVEFSFYDDSKKEVKSSHDHRRSRWLA